LVEVVPLQLRHLEEIGQSGTAHLGSFSYAGLRDGRVVAIAGITEQWTGRGYAWFSDNGLTRREWVEVTKHVEDGLERAGKTFNRIEAAVYEHHDAGHRWAKRLGFRLESVGHKYMPDGSTGYVYARIFGE
jgi:hypothetical protein